jgi:hypothetical protein
MNNKSGVCKYIFISECRSLSCSSFQYRMRRVTDKEKVTCDVNQCLSRFGPIRNVWFIDLKKVEHSYHLRVPHRHQAVIDVIGISDQ